MTNRSYPGRKKPSRRSDRRQYPFYPNQLVRISMAIMGAVAAVAVLAAIFPLPLDRIADPLDQAGPGTDGLWILKPVMLLGSLVIVPAVTIMLTAFLALLFVLLPLLDRSGKQSVRRRWLVAVPFLLWLMFLSLSLILPTGVPG